MNQNKIYIFALFLGILAFSMKLYMDKRPRIADISSIGSLQKDYVVGSIDDTKDYLIASYGIFKNFIPIISYQEKEYFACFRPTSSIVFTPLIFIFREYFPVFGILIFSILTYISFAYLLKSIGLSFIPSAILLSLAFIFSFHYAPRLILEPPTLSLLAISLALYVKGRTFLSAIFLFFGSLLRPEFSIVGFLYLLKIRKLYLLFLQIPLILTIALQNICGDQSNFYFWTYISYLKSVEKNYNREKVKSDVKKCILNKFGVNMDQIVDSAGYFYMRRVHPFLKYHSECWKDMAKNNIRWEVDKVAKHYLENVFFLSIVPKTKLFRFLFPISIIFGVLCIAGLIFYFRKDWFVPLSYVSVMMIYTIYFPFGFLEFTRFKLYILPFEIFLLAQLYRIKIQNIYKLKIFTFPFKI